MPTVGGAGGVGVGCGVEMRGAVGTEDEGKLREVPTPESEAPEMGVMRK